jgi:hypothetical protein
LKQKENAMSFGSEAPGTALAEQKRMDETLDTMLRCCTALQSLCAGVDALSRRMDELEECEKAEAEPLKYTS